jgi:hypothetical protein
MTDGTTTDTKTADTTTTDTGVAKTDAPDLAAQVAALTTQLAAMATERDAEKAKAEEAKRASMTEAEKLTADRAALDAEKASLKTEARKAAAERLGIMPKAMALAPDVDPRTPEGGKALADWARENPEFVTKKDGAGTGFPLDAPPKSALAKFFSGETVNKAFSIEHAKALLGGR